MKKLEIAGQKFGRLTAVRRSHQNSSGGWFWIWLCDCGKEVTQRPAMVKNGHTSSCGCLRVETSRATMTTHGMRSDPRYNTWAKMHARCKNEKTEGYENYGGRGIIVDPRWDNFMAFVHDMGPKPTSEHSIERIDNNGNYTPNNCRWATHAEQNQNTCGWGMAKQRNILAQL